MQIIILMNSLSIISTSFVAHFYFLLFFFMVIISSKLKAVFFLMVGWYCPDITKALAEMEKEMSLTSVPSVMLL